MKYAFKTQIQNPNRPAGVRDNDQWLRFEIPDEAAETFTADGYIVLSDGDLQKHFDDIAKIVVPTQITPRQARQALLLAGYTAEEVIAGIDSIPDPTVRGLARIEWEYSTAFIRTNPLVNNVAALLGWTQKQVDDLFILGASL